MADVKLPQLGESVTEGTLGKWLKQVGETVAKYDPLVEIVTDKVNAEVPSDFEGVLSEILVEEGETVSVGTVICRIREASGAHEERAPSQARQNTGGTDEEKRGLGARPREADIPASVPNQAAADQNTAAKGPSHARFSPAVLKLSSEHGVDLNRVSGSGEGGRITRKDLLAYVAEQSRDRSQGLEGASTPRPAAEPDLRRQNVPVDWARSEVKTDEPVRVNGPASVSGPSDASAFASAHTANDDEIIEPSAIRKTIAKRMSESKHNAPHAWTMVEADVSKLVSFRNSMKADFKRKEGIDLTFLPFFIKAAVEGLKQYPMVNAAWIDGKIHLKRHIHMSLAVATDDALAVPVIHDADRLSIAGLAHAVNELAAKARSGRLTLNDVQGGTFTVNNTGAFGSILSQPILNAPQAGILSFESIVKRPVVVGDAIAIRSMVNLSLSLDHRVLDGWIAGQFLKAVKERLEAFDQTSVVY